MAIMSSQHTAIHYNTLQHTATHCNTLQHTATHCNSTRHGKGSARIRNLDEVFVLGNKLFVTPLRHASAPRFCCSVLQCVAVCCSVLQCVAVCCSVLQCVAVCCSVYCNNKLFVIPSVTLVRCVYVAVCCSVMQCVAVYGSVLQCVAVSCSVLQCVLR